MQLRKRLRIPEFYGRIEPLGNETDLFATRASKQCLYIQTLLSESVPVFSPNESPRTRNWVNAYKFALWSAGCYPLFTRELD
jgi:hypothetical protein